jgi:hypothetical protein
LFGTTDKVLCRTFLYAVFPSCMLLGVVSAATSLAEDWDTFGAPFDCVLVGYR